MNDAETRPACEGILLAAGSSSRAGAFKPAMRLGGKPILLHALEGMRPFCRRVIVVGGFSFGELERILGEVPDVILVRNENPARGMFSSVRIGLEHVRADACFILPADIPRVPPDVYRLLLEGSGRVRIPLWRGRRGHPVFVASGVIPAILAEPEGVTLRDCLHRLGAATVSTCHEEILLDVDTPQDLASLEARLAAG
ncbi:MAG: nucleotidyltransferase family protein [Bacteroidota bacterium]